MTRQVGLAEVRDAALGLLHAYESTDGLSPADDYHDAPRVHPMAEAKYLLACVELREAGVLAEADLHTRGAASLSRLRRTQAVDGPDAAAWGLGFPFRDLDPAEPFTITTALVLNALHRVRPHLTGADAAAREDLTRRTTRWLLDGLGRVEEDGCALPRYSPGLPLVANNVVAYWAGALSQVLPAGDPRLAEVRDAAATVLERFIDGVGWVYERGSRRVDLVHTGYLGWGLRTALPERRDEVEEALLVAVLQFSGHPWVDWFDVLDVAEVVRGEHTRGGRVTRLAAGHALVGFHKPARSWSRGEVLVLLGTLAGSPRWGHFCRTEMRALAGAVVRDGLGEQRYRHSMHLAHGLSLVVRTTHERRRSGT